MSTQNNEFLREIQKKKNSLWLSLVIIALFGIAFIVAGLMFDDDSDTLLGIFIIAGGSILISYLFSMLNRFNYNPKDYYPGRGFKYYRNSKKGKVKILTYAQWGLVAFTILAFYYGIINVYFLSMGVIGVLAIQFNAKKQITLHRKSMDFRFLS